MFLCELVVPSRVSSFVLIDIAWPMRVGVQPGEPAGEVKVKYPGFPFFLFFFESEDSPACQICQTFVRCQSGI